MCNCTAGFELVIALLLVRNEMQLLEREFVICGSSAVGRGGMRNQSIR